MKTKLLLLATFTFCFQFLYSQTIHVSEDFNSGSLPAGWNNTAVTGNSAWSFGLDGSIDHGGNNNIDGTRFAYFDDSNLGLGSLNNRASLETPAFNNVTNGATFLEFDYNFRQFGNSVPDSFIVEVFDGTNWNLVFSRDFDDCGNYLGCNTFPRANVDITAFKNAACKVRFVYFDGNDWGWYVGMDNVEIFSPLANDVGVLSLISPQTSCGLTASEQVTVRIFNYGSSAATGFPVSYVINGGSPVTETITTTILPFDSLDYTFISTANFSTVGNYHIDSYTSHVLDGNVSNDSSSSIVENYISFVPYYFEGFEAGLGGWTIEGSNPSWVIGAPSTANIGNAALGSNAAVTNLSGPYNNNENSRLVSPCLDFSSLTADPELKFALNYTTENPFDRIWLEYSTDQGSTWSKSISTIGSRNWYNDTILGVWTGSSNGWVSVKNMLTGTAGFAKVLLRFVFTSDGIVTADGVGIDNIAIIEPQAVDIEAYGLVDPVASAPCGIDSSQQVTMRVFNNGQNPITTFDAGYRVNSNTAILENGIIPSSPIAPNSFYIHTFSQNANMYLPGPYLIDIWAKVQGDSFSPNDSLTNILINNKSKITPFFSDFESDNAGSDLNLITINTTVDRWVQVDTNNTVTWKMHSGGTASGGTGPTVDHTTGTAAGKYIYIETSTGNSSNPAQLVSPCLNIGNGNSAQLSFWYHMHGATIGTLEVEVFDGSTWTSVRQITGQQQSGQNDPWTEEIVSLSAYAGSSIQLRFSANRTTSFTGDIAIDDILIFSPIPQDAKMGIFLAPTNGCELTSNSPVIIEVENFGTTAIQANSVYLYYQVDNLPPVKDTLNSAIALGAQVIHTFTNSPDLSNSGQTYRIKAWCELSGDSNIGNDTTYQTVTNNVKILPFNEDFSSFNGQNNNNGWEFNPNTTTGVYWTSNVGSTGSANTGPDGDHTTGNGRYVYLETSGAGGPSFLISPCIDLTNVSGAVLNFWYHKYGLGMNDLFVDVYDDNLGIWINNIDVIRGQTQIASADPWKEHFVNISQFAGEKINFRFRGLDDANGFRGDMAVDDILIFEPIPQDAKVDSLNTPQSGCNLTPNELVCFEIENFGTQDITYIKTGYSINNGPPVYDSSVVLIIPGAKFTYCFNAQRANLSAPGEYDFKIWTDLLGDTLNYNDTLIQTVSNEVLSFPNCEDFESLTNDVGKNGLTNSNGKFSNNWKTNRSAFSWEVAAGADHTTGIGNYMLHNGSSGSIGEEGELISPCYDLTNVSSVDLEFWYIIFGPGNGLYIDIFDGQSWHNEIDSVFDMGSSWNLERINLSSFKGGFINIRFRLKMSSSSSVFLLDDVCLVTPPSSQVKMVEILDPPVDKCSYSSVEKLKISMLNTGNNNIDSVLTRIVIDSSSNSSGSIFVPYFDTTILINTSNLINQWLPGDSLIYETPFGVDLSGFQYYRMKVQLFLQGDTDTTDNIISNYIFEHKSSLQIPVFDDFETLSCNDGGPFYSNGFERSNGLYQWKINCGPDRIGLTGPNYDHTRRNNFGKYFVTNATVGDSNSVALIEMPCINMNTISNPALFYWYHMFGFQMGTLFVDIKTSGAWITVDSIVGQQQISNADQWLQRKIDLSVYSGTFSKIRFRSKRGSGTASNMAIDDITILDSTLVSISKYDVINNFSIYPNPSNGIFTIESSIEGNQEYEIEVRNMKGQLVYNTSLQSFKNYQLDLANQAKGVYFIQIRNQDNVFSEKLIIH